ncbi:MAG: DUF4149 domain-containing protein [Candidatus Obscuribacterales bacterium]|nr:DUF4149 domain-containing protein [Candidatus Obscuribacterales bacterium]
MHTLSTVLRTVALALLSGGSAAIVFSAIVLVKAATAQGVPLAEAAANNAPLFLQYGKVALGAAVLLALGEIGSFTAQKPNNKLAFARLLSSVICIICAFAFALVIVPPMEQLLPSIKTMASAQEDFHKLHEISRAIFGASILCAFISLLLPIFEKNCSNKNVS